MVLRPRGLARSYAEAAAMRIGVDFDNTIVCYDRVFLEAAIEEGLVPADLPAGKTSVKDHLVLAGREADWTRLQGRVYGADIARAEPFPGVCEFFLACRRLPGVDVSIVSHKTRHPYAGPMYDLHGAAMAWLRKAGFFDERGIGLTEARVHLVDSKASKFERIRALGLSVFVDDLIDFLVDPAFPPGVARIWFDSAGSDPCTDPGVRPCGSWEGIQRAILHE